MPACAASALSATTEAAMRQRMLKQLQHYNVVGVLNVAQAESMSTWRVAAPGRIIPGTLPLDPLRIDPATVARVKAVQAAGTLAVLGDVGTQHGGIALDDPRMEAFWQLAETLELPVGMHIGRGATDHRHVASTDSPRAIARVLTRHPRLRVYLMQAGDPMLEDLLAVLEAHPQLYVDVGQLAYTQSRPAFYRDLQAMVDAGFGDRLMFGSGNRVWPESIGRAIDIVDDAPFLDARQKRDIFYNNAARFLRLSPQQRAQHQAS
jgi:predicted TIM-barrel fold metal-dependent hydrolase